MTKGRNRWVGWTLLCLVSACSSSSKLQTGAEAEFEVREILANPIRVRWPESEPANPWAGPGGEDFQSKQKPNEAFDCEDPKSLYASMDLAKIRECLASVAEPIELRLALRRQARPTLHLVDDAKTPVCFLNVLADVPVPREVFVLTPLENAGRECWNARIPLEADKVLDVSLPKAMLEVRVRFPLEILPSNDTETLRWMTALSLTPFFWSRDDGKLYAKRVTRGICQKCFKDRLIFEPHPEIAPSKTWPP